MGKLGMLDCWTSPSDAADRLHSAPAVKPNARRQRQPAGRHSHRTIYLSSPYLALQITVLPRSLSPPRGLHPPFTPPTSLLSARRVTRPPIRCRRLLHDDSQHPTRRCLALPGGTCNAMRLLLFDQNQQGCDSRRLLSLRRPANTSACLSCLAAAQYQSFANVIAAVTRIPHAKHRDHRVTHDSSTSGMPSINEHRQHQQTPSSIMRSAKGVGVQSRPNV